MLVFFLLGLFLSSGLCQTTAKPEITKSPSTVGEKSKAKCLEYSKHVYTTVYDAIKDELLKFDTCKASEPLIVGGKNAEPKEFPHQVALGAGSKEYIFWRGGGSLVSERFVLSAAHLISDGLMSIRWARIGDYNLSSTEDEAALMSKSVTVDIQETIPHPKYIKNSFYNDIVLFRLKEDVVLGEFIRPICLHTEFDIPKKYAIATGFGFTKSNGRMSDVLQKVNVTIQSEEECTRMWGNANQNLAHGFDNSIMICAGDVGKDACYGDSGSPLQLRLPDPYHCMYAQIGIVSYGYGCGTGVPGGFTRVSEYVSWIEETVWP